MSQDGTQSMNSSASSL